MLCYGSLVFKSLYGSVIGTKVEVVMGFLLRPESCRKQVQSTICSRGSGIVRYKSATLAIIGSSSSRGF